MQETSNHSDTPRRLRVFLCHSSGDKPAVRDLYRRLVADGLDPWLDEERLLPGQDWREEIPQAVHNSDVVIVCLSQASITKEGYLQKEVKYALDVADEKPEGTIFIIPLKLEECDVPRRLSQWQWASMVEPDGYPRLLLALKARAETMPAKILSPPDTPSSNDVSRLQEGRQQREFPGSEEEGRGSAQSKVVSKHPNRMKAVKLAGAGLLVLVALGGALRYSSQHGKNSPTPQEASAQGSPSGDGQLHLRSAKAALSEGEAKVMIVTNNFYHARWNEGGKGIAHKYETKAYQGALVVIDHATGLMWQRGGSGEPVQGGLQGTEVHIRDLNAKKFGGFEDWRLPTLEEAMSLMTTPEGGVPGEAMNGEEKQKGVDHIDRSFEIPAAYFIWTADMEGPGRGWVVYFWDGICDDEKLEFNAYVRAVRSLGKPLG